MIASTEALRIVLEHKIDQRISEVTLQNSIGKILAEDITADRAFPPFDRVTMDGIAIDYKAYAEGVTRYGKAGIATAGSKQMVLNETSMCIEVMTGAILPTGTDTVIRYEDLHDEGDAFTLNANVKAKQNVHKSASDAKSGELLLPAGARINAMHINILATVGRTHLKIVKPLSVAIIATGNELAEVGKVPLQHQIRMSNAHMIAARLKEIDIPSNIYHLIDDQEILEERLIRILEAHDVLILSGGVSKGKLDFVPDALANIGVKKLFHRVAQRPGKPMWFGVLDDKAVFALPGNPVSTFACFHRYFMPWYRQYLRQPAGSISIALENDVSFAPALTYYAQAKLKIDGGWITAIVSHGRGSGDIVHPTTMDGFVVLPSDKSDFSAGDIYEFIPFRPLYQ